MFAAAPLFLYDRTAAQKEGPLLQLDRTPEIRTTARPLSMSSLVWLALGVIYLLYQPIQAWIFGEMVTSSTHAGGQRHQGSFNSTFSPERIPPDSGPTRLDGSHSIGDFRYHTLGRDRGTLLPADDPAQIIARKEDVALWLEQLLVSRLRDFQVGVGKQPRLYGIDGHEM